MNKRIKDLLAKCSDPEMTKPWPFIDTNKLVELIVLECAKVALLYTPESEEMEYGNLIQDKIKEHFGVE